MVSHYFETCLCICLRSEAPGYLWRPGRPLTDTKGRRCASSCTVWRKHDWSHDFIVLKAHHGCECVSFKGQPRCAAAENEDQTHTYQLRECCVLLSEQTHRFNKTQRRWERGRGRAREQWNNKEPWLCCLQGPGWLLKRNGTPSQITCDIVWKWPRRVWRRRNRVIFSLWCYNGLTL